jgi:hypothetical protein
MRAAAFPTLLLYVALLFHGWDHGFHSQGGQHLHVESADSSHHNHPHKSHDASADYDHEQSTSEDALLAEVPVSDDHEHNHPSLIATISQKHSPQAPIVLLPPGNRLMESPLADLNIQSRYSFQPLPSSPLYLRNLILRI